MKWKCDGTVSPQTRGVAAGGHAPARCVVRRKMSLPHPLLMEERHADSPFSEGSSKTLGRLLFRRWSKATCRVSLRSTCPTSST